MQRILGLTLIIYINLVKQGHNKEIYEQSADDLFKEIVGDIYKVNHKYTTHKDTFLGGNETVVGMSPVLKYLENSSIIESENFNDTYEDIKRKHHERYIDELLKEKVSPIPNFQLDDDHIGLTSRRFDDLRSRFNISRRNEPTTYVPLYRHYQSFITIMEQFIYATRYRLPYSQVLRVKYKESLRYKIGYCFALLRNLKQQQMILFNALENNLIRQTTLYYHMFIYEKVVRLNVDIKDVIKLVKKLEAERKEKEKEKSEENEEPEEKKKEFNPEGFSLPPGYGGQLRSAPKKQDPRLESGYQYSLRSSPARERPRRLWSPNGKNKNIFF